MSEKLTWAQINPKPEPELWRLGTVIGENTLIWHVAEVKANKNGNWLWAAIPNWKDFEKKMESNELHFNETESKEKAMDAAIKHLCDAGYLHLPPKGETL